MLLKVAAGLNIADPSTVCQANLNSSDDYTDAEYLAERLRTNSLKHYEPLNKNTRAVRDVFRQVKTNHY